MIEASARTGAANFIAVLRDKAETLARARGETILRERKRDPWRWREARLLWPLFSTKSTKG